MKKEKLPRKLKAYSKRFLGEILFFVSIVGAVILFLQLNITGSAINNMGSFMITSFWFLFLIVGIAGFVIYFSNKMKK